MNPLTYIVNMIIKIGEKQPNVTNAISMKEAVEAFTSSPCLLHDCLIFIGVCQIGVGYLMIFVVIKGRSNLWNGCVETFFIGSLKVVFVLYV